MEIMFSFTEFKLHNWKISENVAFCARLCEEDSRCISFGYQARTKTCQGQSNKEYNPIYGSTAPGVFNFFLMLLGSKIYLFTWE